MNRLRSTFLVSASLFVLMAHDVYATKGAGKGEAPCADSADLDDSPSRTVPMHSSVLPGTGRKDGESEESRTGAESAAGVGDGSTDLPEAQDPLSLEWIQYFISQNSPSDEQGDSENYSTLCFTPGSTDQKDYIRLLNMQRLLKERRQEIIKYHQQGEAVPFKRRLQFLISLSRQADGMSTQEGFIRRLSISSRTRQNFWKRLSYMHHGLLLEDLDAELRRKIVNAIWEGKESKNLVVEQIETVTCLETMLLQYDPSSTQIRRVAHRNTSTLLQRELNSFYDLESFFDELLSIETDRNQHERMCREWPFRIDEAWSGYWFSGGGLFHPGEPLHATVVLKIPDNQHPQSVKIKLNEIYKNPALPFREKFERAMEILKAKFDDATKNKRASQKEAGRTKGDQFESVCNAAESAIAKKNEEIKRKLEKAQLNIGAENEDKSKRRKKEKSNSTVEKIMFYMEILNEYENLKIALTALSHFIEQAENKRFSLSFLLQTLNVVTEAFNNVVMPLHLDSRGDILMFRETLRYIRNKVCEHPDSLQTEKYKEFLRYQVLENETIYEILRRIKNIDMMRISENLKRRLSVLRAIVSRSPEESREQLMEIWDKYMSGESLKGGDGKPTDPEKYETYKSSEELLSTNLWTYNGLPALEGLRRYFFHPTYSLDNVLVTDRKELEALSRLVYVSEHGWRSDFPINYSFSLLDKKIRRLIYFLPVYYDCATPLRELEKRYRKIFLDRHRDQSLKYEMRRRAEDTEIIEGDTPVLDLTEQPDSIDSRNIKLQVLHRVIGDIYECLDGLISKDGMSFFENFELRYRNLLRYLYQNLRERRNFFAHDLWRVFDERSHENYRMVAERTANQIVSVFGGALNRISRNSLRRLANIPSKDFPYETDFIEASKRNNVAALKKAREMMEINSSILYMEIYGPEEKIEIIKCVYENYEEKKKPPEYRSYLRNILWYGKLFDPTLGINFVDMNGRTALHYAARMCDPEVVRYLLAEGSFPDLKDDEGKNTIEIIEERLNKEQGPPEMLAEDFPVIVITSSEQRREFQEILLELKEVSLLQDTESNDEPHRSVVSGDLDKVRSELERVFSVNTYNSRGETLLGLSEHKATIFEEISTFPGVDKALVPLTNKPRPVSVVSRRAGEYPFYSVVDSQNPRNFQASYERPVKLTNSAAAAFSIEYPHFQQGIRQTRPGYYRSGRGLGNARSLSSGLEDMMLNDIWNSVHVQFSENMNNLLSKNSHEFSSDISLYRDDFNVLRKLPWSPRWIFRLLTTRHDIKTLELSFVAMFEGEKKTFKSVPVDTSHLTPFHSAFERLKQENTTSAKRRGITDSISLIFKTSGLPRGIFYPRSEEKFIKKNHAFFENRLPESIVHSQNFRALRSRLTYSYFLINMLKKWIAEDIPDMPTFTNDEEFVQYIKGTEWDAFSEILIYFSENVSSVERTLSDYFMESSLYVDFIDFYANDGKWLELETYPFLQSMFQSIADFANLDLCIWRESSKVGETDLELEKHFPCSDSRREVIHFLRFTDESGEKEGRVKFKLLIPYDLPLGDSHAQSSDNGDAENLLRYLFENATYEPASKAAASFPTEDKDNTKNSGSTNLYKDSTSKEGKASSAHVDDSLSRDRADAREEDQLRYSKDIVVPLAAAGKKLSTRKEACNVIGAPSVETLEIDGTSFRKKTVDGTGMNCFFNAMGLNRNKQAKKLRKKRNDPIVRYMIANEIVASLRNPDQLPKSVRDIIQFTDYQKARNTLDQKEEQRNQLLSEQSPDDTLQDISLLPPELQNLSEQGQALLENVMKMAYSLPAFDGLVEDHIKRDGNMMAVLQNVQGEAGDNENSDYTSIDAIAYINNLGIKVYRVYKPSEHAPEQIVKLHEFIPEGATEISYLLYDLTREHFDLLVPL